MTDTLATKQDLHELEARIDTRFAQTDARFSRIDARFDYLEKHLDTRLAELEKRLETRLAEQEKRLEIRLAEQEKRNEMRSDERSARFGGELADLERRVTFRLGGISIVATIGASPRARQATLVGTRARGARVPIGRDRPLAPSRASN